MKKSLTALNFFERFTESEQDAILACAVPAIKRFAYKLSLAGLIQSDDVRVPVGREALIALGIITPERASVIFDFLPQNAQNN